VNRTLPPEAIQRYARLGAARQLIKSARLTEPRETYELLCDVIAAMDTSDNDMAFCRCQLEDAADLLKPVDDEPEPELSGCDQRGEYDRFTQNVRNRA
jgi:hypothetical protein